MTFTISCKEQESSSIVNIILITIRILISVWQQKVVIKVSMHGDKSRTKAMDIFIEEMKAMFPFKLLWNRQKPSAAKHRIKAMQVAAGMPGTKICFSHPSLFVWIKVLMWCLYGGLYVYIYALKIFFYHK